MKSTFCFPFLIFLLVCCNQKKSNTTQTSIQLDSITKDAYKKLFSGLSDWSSMEVKVSDEEKLRLFKKNISWVPFEYIDSTYLSSVSILDFNGDGTNDFIYSG
jgi:hypothetical protein